MPCSNVFLSETVRNAAWSSICNGIDTYKYASDFSGRYAIRIIKQIEIDAEVLV